MIFKQIRVGDMDNFCYILGSEGEAAVVDPGFEHEKILDICEREGLNITRVFLTHGHFDHVQELPELVSETHARVFVHKQEPLDTSDMDVTYVEEGDVISFGDISISVIETPGHTAGGVCYLVNNTKLISGDTLFVGAIGRCDLAGANLEHMKRSLARLKELDETIEVYPGHDYGETPSSTIKQEKENNPYLQ